MIDSHTLRPPPPSEPGLFLRWITRRACNLRKPRLSLAGIYIRERTGNYASSVSPAFPALAGERFKNCTTQNGIRFYGNEGIRTKERGLSGRSINAKEFGGSAGLGPSSSRSSWWFHRYFPRRASSLRRRRLVLHATTEKFHRVVSLL